MTTTLDSENREQLLDRFLRYVKVDTRSDEASESSPTTEKQKDLSRMLAEELKALGCDDAAMNEWGYVFATVPSNLPDDHPAAGKVPTIGLIAHVDTYFGTSGKDVKPQIIENYDGGDIELNADQVLKVADNPNLAKVRRPHLIHTDGTTLLGADDKAGVAEIMTAVAWIKDNPEFLHGPIRIAFTTDEEVGRGTEHFDVEAFGADYAYTLDGSDLGEIEDETFCADTANVTHRGPRCPPRLRQGQAGQRAPGRRGHHRGHRRRAGCPRPPRVASPTSTPTSLRATSPRSISRCWSAPSRTRNSRSARTHLQRRRRQGRRSVSRRPRSPINIDESYRNMAYKIREDSKVLDYALEAVERIGVTPIRQAIRGGTDGARLSFMGLLTPNVWAGGQNFHSVNEWVSLEWMTKAVEATLEILTVWVEKSV